MDAFRRGRATAKIAGADSEFLTPQEAAQKWPFWDFSDLRGALFYPAEGYVQPADLTMALAALARKAGATILTRTAVTAIARRGGLWRAQTPRGEIACEHIVAATGAFARKTGAMVGLDVPTATFAHQYLVTAPHPDLLDRKKAGAAELPVLRDMDDSSSYLREENGGLLLGPYESEGAACYRDGVPDDVEYHLFDADLERLAPSIETAMRRAPILREAEIKRVYNGAITYTPDGMPLLGPAWGLPNFWLAEGVSFGFAAGGGLGRHLAEWMDRNDPPTDLASVDPRRFADYANGGYAWAKAGEVHERFFAISYPDEELPAARPLMTSPCYGRMKERGAIFGQAGGFERPIWFSPDGEDCPPSFRRGGWFDAVGAEVRQVAGSAGLMDLSPLAKFRVRGRGAGAFLDRALAAKTPPPGRACIAHLLAADGGVLAEFMVFGENGDSFYLTAVAARRRMDGDLLRKRIGDGDDVKIEDITPRRGVFLLAGPAARTVLARAAPDGNIDDLAPMRGRRIEIALAPVLVLRLAFTGEVGFELHHPPAYQNRIFDALFAAGEELRPFGFYALEAMRLEKSHGVIGREFTAEFTALESGLEKFVNFSKGEFVGREALLRAREKGGGRRLFTLAVDAGDADAFGGEPVFRGGEMIGRATSGGYGHRVGKSLALAMLAADSAQAGDEAEIEILGERRKARLIAPSPYNADGRLRLPSD